MSQLTIAGVVFVVLWIATFLPAWWLLLRLLALSSSKNKTWQFWLTLLLQRIVIAVPYVVLLILGEDVLSDIFKNLIIGFVLLGAGFSIIRFMYRDRLIGFLWIVYGYFYDGLLHYAPYRRLILAVTGLATKEKKQAESILELGCGTGNVLKKLEQNYPNSSLVGVDNSPTMIAAAKRKTKNSKVLLADIVDFTKEQPEKSYDLIVMQNVLYAISDRRELWKQIDRILTDKGVVVVTNSDRTGSFSITKEHLKYGKWYELLHPKLIIVGIIDAYISQLSKTGSFDFTKETMVKTEVEKLFDFSLAERVYGGVNILFSLRKKKLHAR